MLVDISDIELAMSFVSSGDSFDNEAYLDKETGDIYYSGDAVDEELPDDIDNDEKYIVIPQKNDFDLGKRLVINFVAEHLPDELDRVYEMFQARGAYAKFKYFLEQLNCTDKWYAYENDACNNAIIQWCKENAIQYKALP